MSWKNGGAFLLGAVLIAGALLFTNREPVQGQGKGGAAGPRYTIVETQGHNLLVTDNGTNTVYFYTVDKDGKVGDDLKLRASVDLSQVGGSVVKIKASK